jgi:hypothetical protein
MALKFYSEEWCAAAMEAINNNDAVYRGFKDPKSFNHKMYFGNLDNDLITHLTFVEAKLTEWTPKPIHGDGPFDFGIKAKVEHWREAAEGRTEGGKLLMGGKLKITAGNIQLAIQNAGAFNNFLLSWGQVDTDWDV